MAEQFPAPPVEVASETLDYDDVQGHSRPSPVIYKLTYESLSGEEWTPRFEYLVDWEAVQDLLDYMNEMNTCKYGPVYRDMKATPHRAGVPTLEILSGDYTEVTDEARRQWLGPNAASIVVDFILRSGAKQISRKAKLVAIRPEGDPLVLLKKHNPSAYRRLVASAEETLIRDDRIATQVRLTDTEFNLFRKRGGRSP